MSNLKSFGKLGRLPLDRITSEVLGGRTQESDYEQALKGIRATVRGEQPTKPDAYLLLHIATLLLECGLRPDECYRPKWNQIQDEAIIIHEGKGKGSRRRVPCTQRVMGILEMRRTESEWFSLWKQRVAMPRPRLGKNSTKPRSKRPRYHRSLFTISGTPGSPGGQKCCPFPSFSDSPATRRLASPCGTSI